MARVAELASEIQLRIFAHVVPSASFHLTPTARKDDAFATKHGFTIKSQRVFDDERTQANYRDAMTDHIINNASEIIAPVTDLNFNNLAKLLNTLTSKGKLHQFALLAEDENGNPVPADRRLVIHHTITSKFGAGGIGRLEKWHKAVEKTGIKDLAIVHEVVAFDLKPGFWSFMRRIEDFGGGKGQADEVIEELFYAYDEDHDPLAGGGDRDPKELEMADLNKLWQRQRQRQRQKEARRMV